MIGHLVSTIAPRILNLLMLSYRARCSMAWNVVATKVVELRKGYIFVVRSWMVAVDAASRNNFIDLLSLFTVCFSFPILIIGA